MMNADAVRYKIVPVTGYTDLERRFKDLESVENVRYADGRSTPSFC
jgi:hypothetical protein